MEKHCGRIRQEMIWGLPKCLPTAVNHHPLWRESGSPRVGTREDISDSGCHGLMNTMSMLNTLFADSDFLC